MFDFSDIDLKQYIMMELYDKDIPTPVYFTLNKVPKNILRAEIGMKTPVGYMILPISKEDAKKGTINILDISENNLLNILAKNYYEHIELTVTYIYNTEDGGVNNIAYPLNSKSTKEIKQMSFFAYSYLRAFFDTLEMLVKPLHKVKESYVKTLIQEERMNKANYFRKTLWDIVVNFVGL